MNKKGQSIIEYALIIILVVLGILYMGPYVLRSINAFFKLWDDSVRDSYTEHITQSPTIPPINFLCTCSDSDLHICGINSAGTNSQCHADEEIYSHICTPNLCDGNPTTLCKKNPDFCCNQYQKVGCGTKTLTTRAPDGTYIPSPSDGRAIPAGSNLSGSGCHTYAFNDITASNPNPVPNCYFGQMMYATQCAMTATSPPIACCDVAPECSPHCSGEGAPGTQICPGSNQNLDHNYAVTLVQNCTGAKCEISCVPPYKLNPAGTSCLLTFQVAEAQNCCKNNPCGNCGAGGICTSTNDQSFTACNLNLNLGKNTLITRSVIDVSVRPCDCQSYVINPHCPSRPGLTNRGNCGHPDNCQAYTPDLCYCSDSGHPGEECLITFNFN
ncbi:MAG: hypothetical protein HQL13_08060 [Candidatus Omnitrophica bacterium]|nr:hypothetical protein [Candidatus Omnitrophota bacterium]